VAEQALGNRSAGFGQLQATFFIARGHLADDPRQTVRQRVGDAGKQMKTNA